ncbi:armadillo-type protein [Tribonema minus]|uniref:Armadillo-type protein n=1 Tax=Tribonema minus TaxID=303371 RepID=A0A835YNT0_9STRA|nr:armadillo-type protein [Tribonema minus]
MEEDPQLHPTLMCEAQVVRMMRTFPEDAGIQVWAARAIEKLSADESYGDRTTRRSLGQAGACAALVTALVTHCHNAAVQTTALRAVCSLAKGCPANCGIFQDADIATALIGAMRTHAAHAGTQVAACMAMASLVSAASSAGVNCAVQLATVGATDALVAAVRAHIQHAMVPKQALYAMYTLALRCLGPADVALPQQLLAAQVAQAVVAAMRTDITEQTLQAAAASAIEGLVQHNDGGGAAAIAQQFLDAGVGEALVEAVAASSPYGAAAHTLNALTALVHHGGSAAQLLAAGGAEAIMAAVGRLCTRGRALSPVVQFGRARVLSAAMKAIAALATKAPADSARLSAAGACQVAVNALKYNISDDCLLDLSLKTLAALVTAAVSHSPAVALSLVTAGACEAATATLNAVLLSPSGSSNVLTSALRAICGLSADASAAARLNTAGAREAVASAIPRCSNHDDAAQSARLALDRLAVGAADASSA